MKRVFLALVVAMLCGVCAVAQPLDVKKKNVENFSNIDVEDYFVLKFYPSDTCSVTVRSDLRIANFVQAYVKGGTLYLSLDEKNYPSDLKKALRKKGAATPVLEADVYLPTMNSVTLKDKVLLTMLEEFNAESISLNLTDHTEVLNMNINAASVALALSKNAKLSGTVNVQNRLNVKASNAANVSLALTGGDVFVEHGNSSYVDIRSTVNRVEVDATGGSESHISGIAASLKVTGAGSSRVDAEQLEAQNGEVMLSGSKCHVNVAENLKVNLSGGSMLTFKREPVFKVERILNSTLITADDEKRK